MIRSHIIELRTSKTLSPGARLDYFRLPYSGNVVSAQIVALGAGSGGSTTVDIRIGGVSYFGTAPTLSSGSTTGTVQPANPSNSFTAGQVLEWYLGTVSTIAPEGLMVEIELNVDVSVASDTTADPRVPATVSSKGRVWSTANATTPAWNRGVVALKFTLDKDALSAAATSKTVTLLTLPAGAILQAVKLKHETAFMGGSLTGYTAEVGVGGDTARWLEASNVYQSPGDAVHELRTVNEALTHAVGGTDVVLVARSIGANLSAATSGSLDVWVSFFILD